LKLRSFLPKNRSLFYRWLLSYISILLIPVIISGFVSVFSEKVMRDETNRANAAMLKQVRQTMDEMTASFEKTTMYLCMDQRLRSLLGKGTYDRTDQYNLYTQMKELGMYISINGHIDNIYIYFRNTGSVLSDVNKMEADYFYDNYFSSDSISYEQFMELLNGRHMMDYYVMDKKLGDGRSSKAIVLIQSLPLLNNGNNMGALIGVIPEEKFSKIVNNLKWVEQAEFIIFDRNDGKLLSDGPRTLPLNMILEAVEGKGNKEYNSLNGDRYIVTGITSETARWKYVLVTPSDVFWEKTRFIRRMAAVGLLMCILAGGILAYFLSRKKYDPIENITQALADKKNLPFEKKYKEYSFIYTAVNENINEIKKAQSEIEKQHNVLRNSFLSDILKGMICNRELTEDTFSSYGIDFTWPNFAVLLFSIDNIDSFTALEVGISSSDVLKMAKHAIAKANSELLKEGGRSYMVDLEDSLFACIINFTDPDMEANSRELDDISKECRHIFEEKLHISFVASISNIHEDISEIPEAYTEVKDAMEYRKLIGGSGISRYEDIYNPRYSYDYSIQTEQKLMNYIKTGDYNKSRDVLEEVYKSNLYDTSFSGEMAKCLMFDITSTIVKTMYEVCDIAFIEDIQPMKRLLKCNTIIEMKLHINMILDEVCKYVNENGKKNCQLSSAALEYINSNYYDNNLNVSTMSKEFNITRSYLSMLFKEQTGQTLIDCINRFRVEKAKLLLKDRKLSIADTALKTGFSSSKVFIRTFRKYEGITPGEYRNT